MYRKWKLDHYGKWFSLYIFQDEKFGVNDVSIVEADLLCPVTNLVRVLMRVLKTDKDSNKKAVLRACISDQP